VKRALVVVAIAVCAGADSAAAQARAGLHAGFSRSALIMDSGDTGFRRGLIGGGWVRFPIVGAVGLQLGAYYVQKGSSDTGEGITADVELDYIDVPLLLAFLLNRTGELSGYINTGGALGILRSCQFSVRAQGASISTDCESFQDGTFLISTDKIDVGFVLGGGVEWDQGPLIFTLDTRATFGLMEAFRIHAVDFPDDDDRGQNLNLALMAGVAFPVGPRPSR
jgi:hypothetical protein